MARIKLSYALSLILFAGLANTANAQFFEVRLNNGLSYTYGNEELKRIEFLEGDPDNNKDNPGDTDITNLEKELRDAIPLMIAYRKADGGWEPHSYQYQRANNIDNYAGYWCVTKKTFAFGGPLDPLYSYPNDYLGGPQDNSVFTMAKNAIFYAEELGKPEWRAIALIIQAYVGHEIVDFYGGCPFNDWRNVNRVPPNHWQAGDEVYDIIFEDLTEAVQILNERQPSADELQKIEDANCTLSQGDYRYWVKFANSIRLRMAMNIVKYDPEKARLQAEKAVADGVFDETDARDMGYYFEQTNTTHSLYKICHSWNDLRLGASLENIMKHLKHPLFTKMFGTSGFTITDKFTGIAAPGDIYGIRPSVAMDNVTGVDKGYGPFGTLSLMYLPHTFFKRAEALFLRAEGALRGWNMGGSAQEFYEKGIRQLFVDVAYCLAAQGVENTTPEELGYEEYINLTSMKGEILDYVDPRNAENNMAGRVSIDVKWNESEDNELKLEKIITQKYIANFPMSAEAWTTFRRTGYPRLFPPKLNNLDGVDSELQIRRMPMKETPNNMDELNTLNAVLGGDHKNGGIRVFWDLPTEGRGEMGENGCLMIVPKNF